MKEDVKIEIGDIKESGFKPSMTIRRWDDEVNFTISMDNVGDGIASESNGVITWDKTDAKADFYKIDNNSFEFEITFDKKPVSNVIEMPIKTNGLKFYYQPELTPEEIDNGNIRPDNVTGSYAVYHATMKGDYSAVGGQNYRAGKAFHIYRPFVIDALGDWIWCDLHIDEASSILSITIDQAWLDKAIYPITVDPTFGCDPGDPGGSWGTAQTDNFYGSVFTSPADVFNALSISAYTQTSFGSYNFKALVILHTDLNIITDGVSSAATASTPAWRVCDLVSDPSITASTGYVLGIISQPPIISVRIAFDVGDTDQGHYDSSNSYSSPTHPTDATHNNNEYSVYVTYSIPPQTPPTPVNLANTTANCWINYTWAAGSGNVTDSYNVDVNGVWTYGLTDAFYNASVYYAEWVNITVYAYNNTVETSQSDAAVSDSYYVVTCPTYEPPAPVNLQNTTALCWINYTWSAGSGYYIDSYNVTINGVWNNGSAATYRNESVSRTEWVNISVFAYNSTSRLLNSTSVSDTYLVDTCPTYIPPTPTNLQNTTGVLWINYTWSAGSGNVTDSFNVSINDVWTNGSANTFYNKSISESSQWVNITVYAFNSTSDTELSIDSVSDEYYMFVQTYIPPTPTNLQNTTGERWINYTWEAGVGNVTDSYNVSINDRWTNGTTNAYRNVTVDASHWINITIYAFNSTADTELSINSVYDEYYLEYTPPHGVIYRTMTEVKKGSTSSIITMSVPDGFWAGDLLIATVIHDSSFTTVNLPAGWTLIEADDEVSTSYRIAEASDTEWTWDLSTGEEIYGVILRYTGHNTTDPIYDSNTVGGSSNTPTSPSVAFSDLEDGSRALQLFGADDDDTPYTTPAPLIERFNDVSSVGFGTCGGAGGDKPVNVTSSTGTAVFSMALSEGWEAVTIIIRSTPTPQTREYTPPDPITLQNASGYYWVNYTWSAGSGNVTDSYNVSVNDVWDNTTSNTYVNTSVSPCAWVNVTGYGYNTSGNGTLSAGSVDDDVQVACSFIPPTPTTLANTTGNFWVNHTWSVGSGNVTDGYNVSQNDTWFNSTDIFKNASVGAHGWSNISVYAWNSTAAGEMNATSIDQDTQVPNNAISITNTSDWTDDEGVDVYVDYDFTDVDDDTATFYCNRSDLFADFNTIDGTGNWTHTYNNSSIIYIDFGVSDGYSSIDNYTMTITVNAVARIPPDPTTLANTTGNFWINHTWSAGSGNVTDFYNVSQNGSWTNDSANLYFNASVGAHGYSDITIWAWNSSVGGTLSAGNITDNMTVPNNAITITNTSDWNGDAGDNVYVDYDFTDADSDTPTFYCNRTDLFTDFDTSAGTGNWSSVVGTYYIDFGVSDGYGSIDNYTMTITAAVTGYIPPDPENIANTTGNFWINHTWSAGSGNVTDSYNVTQNGSWTNDSANLYFNASVGAHGYSNVTIWSWNSTGAGTMSVGYVTDNMTVPNNAIAITVTTTYSVAEGENVFISDTSASDADSDTPTFYCNRTDLFADFDTATGYGNWTTNTLDNGTHYIDIGVSDGYGSTDNATLTITVGESTPTTPTNLQNATGNFWINHTWDTGSNTDTFNVSQNGSWTNDSANLYYNASVGAHGYSNITVYGYNSTIDEMSVSFVTDNMTVPNNAITITNTSDWNGDTGDNVYVDYDATDADSDTPTFYCNRTDLFADFDTSTGMGNWTSVAGTYYIDFGVSDGYGSTDNYTMTITVGVADYTPPDPITLANTTGNFWINHTWSAGAGNVTDSYNVSQNGTWYNGTTDSYYNNTPLPPHGWSNITVWAYNSSVGGTRSAGNVTQDTQIPNNAIIITNTSGWSGFETQYVYINFDYTDVDGDTGTFATNATTRSLNNTTGIFTWTTTDSDSGTYVWEFNVSDGYGSIDVYNATITVYDISAPDITNVSNLTQIGTNMTISFDVNQSNATTRIDFGNTTAMGTWSAWNNTTTLNRTINLTSLASNTTYYYSVYAYNSTNASYYSNSSIYNFTTAMADANPITDLHTTTLVYDRIVWEWTNPSDLDTVMVYFDGTWVENTTSGSFTIGGLTPDTPYTITLVVVYIDVEDDEVSDTRTTPTEHCGGTQASGTSGTFPWAVETPTVTPTPVPDNVTENESIILDDVDVTAITYSDIVVRSEVWHTTPYMAHQVYVAPYSDIIACEAVKPFSCRYYEDSNQFEIVIHAESDDPSHIYDEFVEFTRADGNQIVQRVHAKIYNPLFYLTLPEGRFTGDRGGVVDWLVFSENSWIIGIRAWMFFAILLGFVVRAAIQKNYRQTILEWLEGGR